MNTVIGILPETAEIGETENVNFQKIPVISVKRIMEKYTRFILYSNDQLIFVSKDHCKTFYELIG